MTTVTILIDGDVAQFVYDDAVADLLTLGEASIVRVSAVEPAPGGGWTADMLNGDVLGPFPMRADALDAERAYLTRTRGL